MDNVSKEILLKCSGFDWDEGNTHKNWIKHQVTSSECEQIYFNHPLVVQEDIKHSKSEIRYYSLGQTNLGRLLFIAFTIRKSLIRVISARDMTRNERRKYQKL